jgi:NADPH:quinone reductase
MQLQAGARRHYGRGDFLTIVCHAAAGGVGVIACQWARALGVEMIGVVSTDEKAAVARANGCAHTIVTSRDNIAKRVREITGGKGVPVVYDCFGRDTLEASLDSLMPRGTLVSNGAASGPVVIDTRVLAMKGSIWLSRPAMIHYATPRAHMLDMARELIDLVAAGKIAQCSGSWASRPRPCVRTVCVSSSKNS